MGCAGDEEALEQGVGRDHGSRSRRECEAVQGWTAAEIVRQSRHGRTLRGENVGGGEEAEAEAHARHNTSDADGCRRVEERSVEDKLVRRDRGPGTPGPVGGQG